MKRFRIFPLLVIIFGILMLFSSLDVFLNPWKFVLPIFLIVVGGVSIINSFLE